MLSSMDKYHESGVLDVVSLSGLRQELLIKSSETFASWY